MLQSVQWQKSTRGNWKWPSCVRVEGWKGSGAVADNGGEAVGRDGR